MKLLTAIWLIITTCFVWLTPVVSLASNTTNATFYGIVTVVSNNSVANSSLTSQITNINTSTLITAGYVNAGANNTVIADANGNDIAFQPGNGSSNWMVWVPSIGPNGNISDILYTGNVSGGKLAYFPSNTGMTTLDNVGMELGANFTVEFSGLINTSSGASKYIVEKPGAFTIDAGTTGAGNVTATILSSPVRLEPNGAGALTQLNIAGGGGPTPNNYQQVDEFPANDADYVTSDPAGDQTDLYTITTTAITGVTITGVTIHVRENDNTVASVYGTIRTHATNYATPQYIGNAVFTDHSFTWATNPFTGVAWTWSEIGSLQIGERCVSNGGTTAQVSQTYVEVSYTNVSVTAPVSVAEHTGRVTADGTNLKLYIDDMVTPVSTALLNGTSVPDNGNNWKAGENGAMPYILHDSTTVGGTLQQYISWQYGATFTDQSGKGHDATPSFATTSSDPHVTASLTSFAPTSQAQAPPFSLGNAPNFITTTPGISSNFSTTNGTYTNPVVNVIAQVATASNTPPELPILILGMFFILVCSFVSGWAMRRFGVQSNLYKVGMYDCLLGISIAIAPQAWNFWMLLFFSFIAIALTMGSKHYSW